jgi:hypothetical protein
VKTFVFSSLVLFAACSSRARPVPAAPPAAATVTPAAVPEEDASIPEPNPTTPAVSDASVEATDEPRVRALGALVWRGEGQFTEDSAKIVLIASAPTRDLCTNEPPELLNMSCGWSTNSTCGAVILTTKDGKPNKRGARIEIVKAVDRVGTVGQIRVVSDPDGFSSVEPGDVPALVCK